MTFFYDLNKKLDSIREKPEVTHKQLNERDMSRAAKGYEKYGKQGMQALAKAGREGKDLDPVRARYNKYDESMQEGLVDSVKAGAQSALQAIGSTLGHGSDEDMIKDLQKKAGVPVTGKVSPQQPGQQPTTAGQQSMEEGSTGDYSAKAARAGKDIGKPGKNFEKIAKSAGERYGSKAAGERVAGAVLNKLRHPKEGVEEAYAPRPGDIHDPYGDEASPEQHKAYQDELNLYKTPGAHPALASQGMSRAQSVHDRLNKVLAKKPGVAEEGGIPMTAKQKSFAALAPPKDKITFADKIAGAKKEVDEMLGDVAAEAMRNALGGRKQMADEGNAFTGKLKATPKGGKFKLGNKEFTDTSDIDEGWDDMERDVKSRMGQMKTGEKKKTSKGEVEKTATGLRHTRSYDAKTGETDTGDDDKATGEKRGRGRPKKDKAPERVTAKATKHKGGRKEKVKEGSDEGIDMVKLAKVIQSCQTMDQLEAARKMAQNFLRKHSSGNDGVGFAGIGKDMRRRDAAVSDIERKKKELGGVEERKLSSSEKEEREDIVKGMKKNKAGFEKNYGKDAKSVMYATATKMAKERGPGNPDRKKKEKTEESGTVAGSVAPAAGGKAKKGGIVGKGIYDSLNRDLEAMISESMNVSVNMTMDEHGEPHKNITVSAEGEAAEQLAQLLNLAGMSGQEHGHDEVCSDCGSVDCGCEEMVDENAPDWPTDTEITGDDDPQLNRWAGGLNKPKETGQTTVPVVNRDPRRGSYGPSEHSADLRETTNLGMNLYAELKSFKG